jgi:hypothetical protein
MELLLGLLALLALDVCALRWGADSRMLGVRLDQWRPDWIGTPRAARER